jgi:alkylated DNA repair protein (DNA oxidative demethylase)
MSEIDDLPAFPVPHPGELLRNEIFPAAGLGPSEAADRLGISRQALHSVLTGRAGISANMALRFAAVFGNSPMHWLNMQSLYELQRARERYGDDIKGIGRSPPEARPGPVHADLLSDLPRSGIEPLAVGAVLLRGFAAADAPTLLADLEVVIAEAPFRHMITPAGYRRSVAMSNCGVAGWITDRSGYHYDRCDPVTGKPWPPMPASFSEVAIRAAAQAGYPGFAADACLINRYAPSARLSLHQDRNERDFAQPIVSVSLGLPATFLFGGLQRADPPRRLRLENGDIVVWGGPLRLVFHGIDKLAEGEHPLTGRYRFNLTFRRAL